MTDTPRKTGMHNYHLCKKLLCSSDINTEFFTRETLDLFLLDKHQFCTHKTPADQEISSKKSSNQTMSVGKSTQFFKLFSFTTQCGEEQQFIPSMVFICPLRRAVFDIVPKLLTEKKPFDYIHATT